MASETPDGLWDPASQRCGPAGRDHLLSMATNLAERSVDLLAQAERYEALPYLKQAVAILKAEEGPPGERCNKVARNLLRMALVLLDRNGASGAAGDVECALERLGEPFPVLTELEMAARLDWWSSRRAADAD